MKQLKFFFVLLLSLVGMTAMAQAPTCTKGGSPVTSVESGGKYYIGTSEDALDALFFNIDKNKVARGALTDSQLFTVTGNKDSGWKLQSNASENNNYVRIVKTNRIYHEVASSGANNASSFSINFTGNKALITSNNVNLVHSDGTSPAGAKVFSSDYWYFFKAVKNVTVEYKSGDTTIGTYPYNGIVGDVLTMPTTVYKDNFAYTIKDNEQTKTVLTDGETITVQYGEGVKQTSGTLANGCYFLKSGIGGDDVWMTSLRSVVSLLPGARNFWSVWYVECVDVSKNLYTFRNVGNNKVMTPATDPEKTLSTDDGYLYYHNKRYFVGTVPTGGIMRMKLTKQKNSDVYLIQPEGQDNSYYMAIDNGSSSGTDETQTKMLGDRSLKSVSTTQSNRNWHLVRVEGTDVTGEKGLYNRGIKDLDGYVGGLTTMDPPDVDAPELKPLNNVLAKYAKDYAALTGNVDVAAEKYKQYIEAINAMRKQSNTGVFCQQLVEGRPFWIETIGSRGGYKAKLIATDDGKWNNSQNVGENTVEGTFYVESTPGPGTGYGYVIDPKTGKTTDYEKYYVMKVVKNGKDTYLSSTSTTKYGNYSIENEKYDVWSAKNEYITGRPADFGVKQTSQKANALPFTIVPIIPGIYQISHIAKGWQGDPYLTYNDTREVNLYRVAESYSYFKFRTYNTYQYKTNQKGSYSGVGTYGNLMHSKIEASDNVTAYYVRGGKYAYNDDNTINYESVGENGETPAGQMNYKDWGVTFKAAAGKYNAEMTVYLDELPKLDNANVIQGMQGVVLMGQNAQPNGKDCKVYTQRIAKGSAQDLADNNMLHVTLNPIYIEKDTWVNYYDYFVLAYKTDKEVVGYWHQQPVNGVGLGFYHVKRGQSIPGGKCYLSTADLNYQLKKQYGNDWDIRYLIPYPDDDKAAASNSRAAAPADGDEDVVAGIRLVFRDCNGQVTGIEEAPIIDIEEDELEALTTLYSLDGKKVTAPKSGEIYILNGKKVMF